MSCNLLRVTAFALISYSNYFTNAQEAIAIPRLVVSVTIDQLKGNDIDNNKDFLSENGLRLFFKNGLCYENITYSFLPSDASATIASISTGSTPYYNGIIGESWFDRSAAKERSCTEDPNYQGVLTDELCSAESILTTTLSDELKYATKKKGLVYSISANKDFAILTAGHNANGAYWINKKEGNWCTTTYYENKIPKWVEKANSQQKKGDNKNNRATDLAIECIKSNSLGDDEITDILYIAYSPDGERCKNEDEYIKFLSQTDNNISKLINAISDNVSLDEVLFIVTGTGYQTYGTDSYKQMRYPGGKFYINRSANLLNMYLGAIYGTDKYISGFCNNHLYFNNLLIDKKKIKASEIAYYAKKFLQQCQGVSNVFYCDDILMPQNIGKNYYKNSYNSKNSGDIIIETVPGWEIINESNNSRINTSFTTYQTPIIIYGPKISHETISQPTEIGSIIESISKILKIRAPNSCMYF